MIIPASSRGLNNIAVPNVADVLEGWMTTVTAGRVTKTIVDGEVVETTSNFTFQGMIQPFSAIDLQILSEGERHWEWVKVYTQYTNLNVDDKIAINGKVYRIMNKTFYEQFGYGFYRYDMVNDYTEEVPNEQKS
jgi:hypothetical protein